MSRFLLFLILFALETRMGRGRPKKKRQYKKLSEGERGRAYGMREKGATFEEIAATLKCDESTVRCIVKKYDKEKTFRDLPKSGRSRKTSPREDRNLKFNSLQNRRLTGKAIALKIAPNFTKKRVSVNTIKGRLQEVGLNGRVARRKPWLTKANIKKRFEWAKVHRDWTPEHWRRVIFSDESPFTLFPDCGKMYVRRRIGEEFLPECLAPTVKFGGGKIQVWGCFSYNGAGPLYRIHGKMNGAKYREILKNQMAPYLQDVQGQMGVQPIFQQDNDPKHTSKVAMNYLNNKEFLVLDWASQSPDMNPIENAWKFVKDAIFARMDRASNLDEVFEIVKDEWEKIPIEKFRKLIDRMPKRVEALYKSRGRSTKY
jgi:hypothetical protein